MPRMEDEIDLRRYLEVVWRRRNVIISVILASILAALLINELLPRQYQSQAVILLSEHSAPIYSTPSSAAQVVVTTSFLEGISKALRLPENANELRKVVKVEPVRDTRMMRLKVRYRDAKGAQMLASAFSNTFISRASERVEQKRAITVRRLESVNAQLGEIERILALSRNTLSRIQQTGTLTNEERGFVRSFTLNAMGLSQSLYSELRAAQTDLTSELLGLESPRLIDNPSISGTPVAPRKLVNTLLSGILGLMTGTTLAFVIEYFRTSSH